MFNERNKRIEDAPPSSPVLLLGLNGAPQAGEKFKVYEDESEAKEVANKRAQILREQGIRTKKHITLDEIGRRLALGNFKELNLIIKGDVDGSVEALSDSLQKLSTEEIAVRVVHKAVGAITESDVLLATASDAVIVGFNVRPSMQASRLAENEAWRSRPIRSFTMPSKSKERHGRDAGTKDPGESGGQTWKYGMSSNSIRRPSPVAMCSKERSSGMQRSAWYAMAS